MIDQKTLQLDKKIKHLVKAQSELLDIRPKIEVAEDQIHLSSSSDPEIRQRIVDLKNAQFNAENLTMRKIIKADDERVKVSGGHYGFGKQDEVVKSVKVINAELKSIEAFRKDVQTLESPMQKDRFNEKYNNLDSDLNDIKAELLEAKERGNIEAVSKLKKEIEDFQGRVLETNIHLAMEKQNEIKRAKVKELKQKYKWLKDSQVNPDNIKTDKVQLWKGNTMLSGQLTKQEARKMVLEHKAFIISDQAVGYFKSE